MAPGREKKSHAFLGRGFMVNPGSPSYRSPSLTVDLPFAFVLAQASSSSARTLSLRAPAMSEAHIIFLSRMVARCRTCRGRRPCHRW